MIVTIDGPAAAGKSSVAKALAARLGFEYLDTGAMYRAVTLAAQRAGADGKNDALLRPLLAQTLIELLQGRVILNGEDVTNLIRTAEITRASGAIADNVLVRNDLVARQRRIAVGRDFVCEGRDQGTVVFPDAACKFFLVADAEERARRRQREMAERGDPMSYEDVLAAQRVRDQRDEERDIAPMVPAADAVQVDSTRLSVNAVVDLMEQHVRRCLAGTSTSGTAPPSGLAAPH